VARGEAPSARSSPCASASDDELRSDWSRQSPGAGAQRQASAGELPAGKRSSRSSASTPTRAVSNELELFFFGSVDPGDPLPDQRSQA